MTQGRRARVLVVDDSAVVRSVLRAAIASDTALELAGTAADGASALGMLDCVRPDLILLDVEMPILDGLATLRRLREQGHRTPVIMCSSLTQRGARVTIDALASGATDYIAKPQAASFANSRSFAAELLRKIRALLQPGANLAAPTVPSAEGLRAQPISAVPSVVVIGVSTGGPAALHTLLACFPLRFALPVLVVQHMPEVFTQMLAERLARSCAIPVVQAAEGDDVVPGRVLIARGDWHMEVAASGPTGGPVKLHLAQTPLVNHCRPAVDVLFRSAASVYGSGTLAVVLTGMGSDGLAGARTIRGCGGTVLIQDQATSVVWGMPGAVAQAGLAQRVLPLSLIGPEILRLAPKCGRSVGESLERMVC